MQGSDKDKTVRVTRKVFNTWRSVCGKKTKDLFKRWKTVPEHQTENEFDDYVQGSKGETSSLGRTTPTTTEPAPSGMSKIRMLVKKHSQVEIPPERESSSSGDQHPSTTGWSVHVWGKIYIDRYKKYPLSQK